MIISCKDILEATCGILVHGSEDNTFTGISTDTRNLKEGDIYIALSGQKFDGHDFLPDAILKGAKGLIIAAAKSSKILRSTAGDDVGGVTVIAVEDTVLALGKIARFKRLNSANLNVIAVTGSAGKTTTKDLLSAIISQKYNVISSEGNFNNEIGLPLTLLKLTKEHNAAVVEMGMRGMGEIDWLSYVAQPDIAVITNIGMAHIERLGSVQNILKAKMEIINNMKTGGLVLLNGDDLLLKDQVAVLVQKGFQTVLCGFSDSCDVQVYDIDIKEAESEFTIINRKIPYMLPLRATLPTPGMHNIGNAALAIAAGQFLSVDQDNIKDALVNFRPASMRMNIYSLSCGIKIIDDTYNANPQAVNAALKLLANMECKGGGRRIAVLGTMLEMGEWAKKAHRDIGIAAAELKIDCLVLIGEHAKETAQGAKEAGLFAQEIACFTNNKEAKNYLLSTVKDNDILLIKGSRSMKMEEIVEVLRGKWTI